jgi:hypothetical protein
MVMGGLVKLLIIIYLAKYYDVFKQFEINNKILLMEKMVGHCAHQQLFQQSKASNHRGIY